MKILSEGAILCGADRICAPEYKMAPKMERSWGFYTSSYIKQGCGLLQVIIRYYSCFYFFMRES